MHDWIFVAHSDDGTWPFSAKTVGKFAEQLNDQCGAFGLIAGIANAAKHLDITRKKLHLDSPDNASEVIVRKGVFDDAIFDSNIFDTSGAIIEGGQNVVSLATEVKEMWLALSARHNWSLSASDTRPVA